MLSQFEHRPNNNDIGGVRAPGRGEPPAAPLMGVLPIASGGSITQSSLVRQWGVVSHLLVGCIIKKLEKILMVWC